jgi:CRISPR system Cascade subunit CasB
MSASPSPLAPAPEIAPEVARFVSRLAALGPGPQARLKRNAGNTLAEARGVLPLFFQLLPRAVTRPHDVEACFLVATLYGLNPRPGGRGDLAATLVRVASAGGVSREGVDRRVAVLLDSHRGELPFRLRQAVRLVGAHERPVDWARLLSDLLRWEHPARVVQKAWARSYFGSPD